ncbi:hypothetical protein M404DRAFT_995574 [Pisolithus tinctorius Marx 270]|uniref:Uncharacterized protein n=1 Tax=Pisolithus tinctorius Marx 270 TaxID=870435 RepID=A0A0C3KLC2_PISTI|nr:hypothetical protein M404DRAFT_995574 [Pisolithus tinctorius Marx 270]
MAECTWDERQNLKNMAFQEVRPIGLLLCYVVRGYLQAILSTNLRISYSGMMACPMVMALPRIHAWSRC